MIEQKSIVTDIANGFLKLFNMDRFREIVNRFVKQNYQKGVNEVEKQFQFNVNIGNAQRDMNMLETYTADNIKGMTDELESKLKQELQRGLMNNESSKQIKKRVANIFRGKNPTRFKFEDRIRMIARTEAKRASNMAKFENAKRLGRPLRKYLIVRIDSRTSPICIAESDKYGISDQAIPIDKDFIVRVNGKTIRGPYPPFHVNCRTSVVIIQEEN